MSDGTHHLSRQTRALCAALIAIAASIIVIPATTMAAAGSGFLPDDRAWEMASPADKNGGDVMSEATRTRVSIDGDAIAFASLSAFGDIAGTGIASEYIARRTGASGTSGWSTHGAMPILDPFTSTTAILGLDSLYQGELSDDLSKGILRTYTDLTNAPNVADVPNLYLRDDLLTPGAGSYQLLTDCGLVCGAPLAPSTSMPFVADATPDLGHILFQTAQNLAPGASGPRLKLYEWAHGALRLAGVLPDGTPATCPNGQPCSFAGLNATQTFETRRTISDDGSRVIFTVPSVNNTNGRVGKLYMRVDGTTTVQVNASEKTVPDEPQDAQFEIASADGTKVFFASAEQLTDTPESGLYRYDANSTPHLTLISKDGEPADGSGVEGVIGASEDGDYVYFFSPNQLVVGEPLIASSGMGIFVWHGGVIRYIGTLHEAGSSNDLSSNSIEHRWSQQRLSSRVSPDGSRMLFRAHAGEGLTDYDHGNTCTSVAPDGTGPCSELYLYRADTDQLACVSCQPDGAPATGDADFLARNGTGGAGTTAHLNHPLSDDGEHVFFDTGEPLVGADRNGRVRDVYQYDVETGEVHLLSSGTSPHDSYFLEASRDGRDVFFTTRERLVGWDVDSAYDLYDARAGGGFPEPPASPSAGCVGDVCQGSPPANAPAELSGASERFAGPGNSATKAKKKKKKARHHRKKRHAARPHSTRANG